MIKDMDAWLENYANIAKGVSEEMRSTCESCKAEEVTVEERHAVEHPFLEFLTLHHHF